MTNNKISFEKYEATGNDFIIINGNIHSNINFIPDIVSSLCNRNFGIGSDGLIIIDSHEKYDFRMTYFNSDGKIGSMCGNGGRSAVAFALFNNMLKSDSIIFEAIDGVHTAVVESQDDNKAIINLKMQNPTTPTYPIDDAFFINTGSPHLIIFVKNALDIDVFNKGSELRNSKELAPGGANINFVSKDNGGIFVRTYERGVEDETLSCGTGVTASAIAYCLKNKKTGKQSIKINTKGGKLQVNFTINSNNSISDVFLIAYAKKVFKGEIKI
mgnify:CR=1 FL=1